MRMRQISPRHFKILSFLVLVFGIIWIGVSASLPGGVSERGIQAPQEGFSAPDFTLETMAGDIITLSKLRGRPVLVNLWASWCAPCRSEMPAMEKIYQEYANKGFTILAVNTIYQDNMADVSTFVEEHDLSFPILLDRDRTVAIQYQLQALPSSFFINRDGIIQEVVLGGPMAEALLRTRVETLLEEAP
jgi:cytochrome c biogenesis protein CcmG/thiol:disulfide interchange protein DsbE